MGNTCEHSKEDIDAEKQKFLNMPLEQKRRYYSGFVHVTLDSVLPWGEYCKLQIPAEERVPSSQYRYAPDPDLNGKISIWSGDITTLEIGAIVNSAANPEKGGQVNTAIMLRAGEYFKDEVISHGLAEPGEVLITGGYRLPAKYIVNTLAPRSQDSAVLLNCYRNSLEEAKKRDITTIAFPCIATRKKNAFPVKKAAELVLTTVRNWLQNNHIFMDRVIFCLYKKEDLHVYRRAMQEFFPVSAEEIRGDDPKQRASMFPPASTANHDRNTLAACSFSDNDDLAATGRPRPYTSYTGSTSHTPLVTGNQLTSRDREPGMYGVTEEDED